MAGREERKEAGVEGAGQEVGAARAGSVARVRVPVVYRDSPVQPGLVAGDAPGRGGRPLFCASHRLSFLSSLFSGSTPCQSEKKAVRGGRGLRAPCIPQTQRCAERDREPRPAGGESAVPRATVPPSASRAAWSLLGSQEGSCTTLQSQPGPCARVQAQGAGQARGSPVTCGSRFQA